MPISKTTLGRVSGSDVLLYAVKILNIGQVGLSKQCRPSSVGSGPSLFVIPPEYLRRIAELQ